jgi:predicted ATPase
MGRMAAAREELEEAIAAYDPELIPPSSGYQNPGVLSLGYQALALCYLGYLDQAVAQSAKAVKLARNLNDQFSLAFALHFSAAVHQCRREPKLALAISEETIAVSREYGFPLWTGQGMMWRGWALTELGDIAGGTKQLLEGISTYVATGAQLGITYWLGFLAEAHLRSGRARHALELLTCGPRVIGRGGEAIWKAEIYRLRGEALLRLPKPNETKARRSFEKAIEVARQQGTALLELRATISMAQMSAVVGKSGDTFSRLKRLCEWFREGLDTPDLVQARSVLSSQSSRNVVDS